MKDAVDPELPSAKVAVGDDVSTMPAENTAGSYSKSDLLALRAKHIGRNVALNYSADPIVVLRGEAQHLYDETGAEYLDCVNNVCHVGHCHPHVVNAASSQLAALNTNSRYLHPAILRYSQRVCATLPGDLKVVYWVNSGSEANDLAIRIARAHTRKRGVITVGGAYHGHTQTIIDVSPYKYARHGGSGRRPWVREAPIPDVYSGVHRGAVNGDEAVSAAYAAEVTALLNDFVVAEELESLRRARHASTLPGVADEYEADDDGLTAGCGAFIMESILSCGGQVVPPTGYLARVYAAIRAAGGVTIADEVQVGFGRVGSKFWAFELQGVVPDIVTLGKPMGNGFPVAAVITTPTLAASFANGMEYFNTYGGNPVAGAVANAVLDVIEQEKLQSHAAEVGAWLLDGFSRLYDKYNFIGSVRGTGFMLGLEILHPLTPSQRSDVHCRERKPWSDAAKSIVYAMRARRTLLSVDGMDNNVIKFKPPMAFSFADAKRLVTELDEEMAAFTTRATASIVT